MKVLSLFDGMSCGQIALKKLGLTVDEYYASEIDKYAIQVTQTNFPKTIQVGDVSLLDPNDFQDIDLMLAGSPCQGFSFAGKQLAFDDPRSALFFEFIRLLKAIKPKYFLLENVRMKKEFLEVITQEVSKCYPNFSDGSDFFENRIEPILINSSLLSAQSRQRYYWTNIPGIEQPEDKGIVLKDILEQNPDEIYQISKTKKTERNRRHLRQPDEKSLCMTATMYKGAGNSGMTLVPQKPKQVGGGKREPKAVVEYKAMTEVRTPEANKIRREHKKKTGKDWSPREMRHLVERDDDKMNTLTSALTKQHIIQTKQMLELRKDDESNAITTVSKDSVVVSNDTEERIIVDEENRQLIIAEATKKGYTVIEDGDCFDINYPNSKTRRGRNMKYKCNALTPTAHYMRFENLTWRKLTPLECERLQTVPDNYTAGVSNTQRYKMLGNGWTVDVIAHILANMDL